MAITGIAISPARLVDGVAAIRDNIRRKIMAMTEDVEVRRLPESNRTPVPVTVEPEVSEEVSFSFKGDFPVGNLF